MMKVDTITSDRQKYIGGSDIAIILDLSPFKTRYKLLLEKAELAQQSFIGNDYMEYGHLMEEKIRDYLKNHFKTEISVNCEIDAIITNPQNNFIYEMQARYNSDGINKNTVFEIKTTSKTKDSLEEYQSYLAQLLFGMHVNKRDNGILAVYKRDEEFDTDFKSENLQIFQIKMSDHQEYLNIILKAVCQFIEDLEAMKLQYILDGTIISETGLLNRGNPENLQYIANEISETNIDLKKNKEKLMEIMKRKNIKRWELTNGTKIALVKGKKARMTKIINFSRLEKENRELCEKYIETDHRKARKDYLRITNKKKKKRDL